MTDALRNLADTVAGDFAHVGLPSSAIPVFRPLQSIDHWTNAEVVEEVRPGWFRMVYADRGTVKVVIPPSSALHLRTRLLNIRLFSALRPLKTATMMIDRDRVHHLLVRAALHRLDSDPGQSPT